MSKFPFPRPEKPVHLPSLNDISSVESLFQFRLPKSLSEFLQEFGTGVIGNGIYILNPKSKNTNLNLGIQAALILDAFRENSQNESDSFKFSLHPERGGIFPIGVTDNGDYIFIAPEDADRESIIVADGREPIFEEFTVDFARFLNGLADGTIKSYILDEMILGGVTFRPMNDAMGS